MTAHSQKRTKANTKHLSFAGFAAEHRLKANCDVDETTIVPGKHGQIFDYGDGRIAVMVQPGRSSVWPRTRKKLIEAGFEIAQNGDHEGTALFDPANADQARLAIRVAGIKRKRKSSPSQLKNLKKGPGGTRFASPGTGREGSAM